VLDDVIDAHRIADISGLESGDHGLVATLVDARGDFVAQRTVLFELSGTLAVTVLITRDCRSIRCPTATDAPGATSCLGGVCVDPGCAGASCGGGGCSTGGECAAADPCATPSCDEGVCFYRPDDSSCGAGQVCVPDRGCVGTAGDAAPMDSGVPDAAVDGGDAGDAGDAGDGGCTLGPFSSPEPLTTLNSTSFDCCPTVTADGQELYFVSNRATVRIFHSTRSSAGVWAAPDVVDELGDMGTTGEPAVTGDGLTLYFESDRDSPSVLQLYVATRGARTESFGTPSLVGGELTTLVDPRGVTVTGDHLELFLTVGNEGSTGQIWRMTRDDVSAEWSGALPVDSTLTGVLASFPGVSRDGLELFYQVSDEGAPNDVYVARRPDRDSPFGTPTPVPNLSRAGIDEGDPALTLDGRELYLNITTPTDDTDIFVARRECL
jgi:hypothetical protein